MWPFILMITNLIGLLLIVGMNRRIRFQLLVLYWAIALNVFYLLHNFFFVYTDVKALLEDWISLVALITFTYILLCKEKKLLYYIEIKRSQI